MYHPLRRAIVVPDGACAYNAPMLVGDIGEFALIDRLASSIEARNRRLASALEGIGASLGIGIGDDAASWSLSGGVVVATTDTMVDGVHFVADQIGWRDLGYKSIAANQSDVAAMGCLPTFALVTLGLHENLSVEGLEEMYAGMADACEASGGMIVGGDIVRSPAFFVTVALEGITPGQGPLLRRNAARPGDAIGVTGHLGCSAGGLRLLSAGEGSAKAEGPHLTAAHFRPVPRVREGVALRSIGVRSAMDISDGLLDDLGKLCRASGVGASVEASEVPADRSLKSAFPNDWLMLALGGGEDYELLFTAPPEIMDRAVRELETSVSVIGVIRESPPSVEVLDEAGTPIDVASGGWDHFSRPP